LKKSFLLFYNKFLKKFLKILGYPIFLLILIFYKLYLWLQKRLSFLRFTRGRILNPFNNLYIIHLIIIIIALFIIINNEAYAITSEPARGESILASLVLEPEDEEEVIIEEEMIPSEFVLKSYQEPGAALRASPGLGKEEIEEAPVIVQGGTAFVKPNLPTMTSPRTRDKTETYIVQSGDTISSIAAQFAVSIDTILWENKLGSFDYIRPDQSLAILPVSGLSYKVKKGETIKGIAKKYGVEPEEIIDFNKLVDASDINTDQILIIPGGRIIYAPVPPRTSLASLKDVLIGPSMKEFALGMIWPTITKRISQYFSWRHTGIDINGEMGDPIWAVADGVVQRSLCTIGGYGCNIIINHGGGKQTLYAHARKLLVKAGETVKKGQLIAEEGSTGRSTGSHLHFEIRISGRRVNPFSYMK
jgi:murein DD-endopeptidase MepM/ murein hydrolase activator NlpD